MNAWIRQEAWMRRYSEYPARPVGAHCGINEYADIIFDVVVVQVVFDVASTSSCSIVSSSLVRVPIHHVSCFMMQVSTTNVSYPSIIKKILLPGNTILRRNAMIAYQVFRKFWSEIHAMRRVDLWSEIQEYFGHFRIWSEIHLGLV